jgi:hypothetical protein
MQSARIDEYLESPATQVIASDNCGWNWRNGDQPLWVEHLETHEFPSFVINPISPIPFPGAKLNQVRTSGN